MARSKYEKEAQKELESQNWIVDWKIRPTRPTKTYSVDYFNLFDLMAYRAGDPLRLIAIKGRGGVPQSLKRRIETFTVPVGVQKEIWDYNPKRKSRRVRKQIIE